MMRRLFAIAGAAVLLGACSNAASTTTSADAATTVEATIAATTVPPPSSTTTTPVTIATTTTQPVTTTTVVSTEALIEQAVQDYIAAYFACGQAPAKCDPSTFTATQGPSRATVTELITGMIKEGLYFSTDLRGSYLVAESAMQTSPTEATATFCAYDALIVEGPNGPDGLPTVVNDEILSIRYEYRVFLEGTAWRVGQQTRLTKLEGGEQCASPA